MTWHFGADSGTNSNPCGMEFYLGRMGYNTTLSIDWAYSGSAPSFAYWNLLGPGNTTSVTQATDAGKAQADAFWNNYWGNLWPGQLQGYTMFGAISPGTGGWLTSNVDMNRALVNGFLAQLAYRNNLYDYSQGTTLGLYGSQVDDFQDVLLAVGTDWVASEPVVIWVADIASSYDCATVESEYCPMPTIAGYFPMIWQYEQNPDHDITPYDGGLSASSNYTFHPVSPPGVC